MNDHSQQMVHVWQRLFFDNRTLATHNVNPDYATMFPSFQGCTTKVTQPSVDWSAYMEDEEDVYDWYTFARAVVALKQVNDEATVVALQAMAFALKVAAYLHLGPLTSR